MNPRSIPEPPLSRGPAGQVTAKDVHASFFLWRLGAAISSRASGEPAGRAQELETINPHSSIRSRTFQATTGRTPGELSTWGEIATPPSRESGLHRADVDKGTVRVAMVRSLPSLPRRCQSS